MSGDRKPLNMDLSDFDDFAPKPRSPTKAEIKRAIDKRFPSREASTEGQLNMRGDIAVLERFKQMCKDDRRTYVAMLEILMDKFEQE